MFRKILVGYDDSDQARDALALGRRLADAAGAELVVAGVFHFDPLWSTVDANFSEAETEFARKVEEAAAAAGAESEAVRSKSPAHGLHDLAEEIEADLILVGSAHHGRAAQILAGSVGLALLQGAPCAVGVAPRDYRERPEQGFSEFAVGYDGSAEAEKALQTGAELARATGAKLRIITAAEPPAMEPGWTNVGRHQLTVAVENEARERLAEARGTLPDEVNAEPTLVNGGAVEALLEKAAEPSTVLVVGSRAYGPLRRVLLGSVSTRLMRSAPCPLIVMPRGMHEEDERTAAGAEAQSA